MDALDERNLKMIRQNFVNKLQMMALDHPGCRIETLLLSGSRLFVEFVFPERSSRVSNILSIVSCCLQDHVMYWSTRDEYGI